MSDLVSFKSPSKDKSKKEEIKTAKHKSYNTLVNSVFTFFKD